MLFQIVQDIVEDLTGHQYFRFHGHIVLSVVILDGLNKAFMSPWGHECFI
jgi:hypothetical protein